MQNDNRLNKIFAFIVFLVSTVVYFKTVAPTTSFWDCGEFITSAYILGVPHPPGAPFYLLIGRIFSIIPFAADIGYRVNIVSALSSGLTVLFTYLIIVRLIKMYRGENESLVDQIIVFGSGVIGSLSLAFSDSFWFNSVEAEVYSISLFFTALVVWLILRWYERADAPSSDKYLLLIAYSIGLVIGVHLLSILALPALFLLMYFRKADKLNWTNFMIAMGIGAVIFIAIYPGTVKWIPNLALFLKNSAGAGFTVVFFIAALIALTLGLHSAIKNKKRILFLALSSFLLILVAVSTYTAIYIRSNLNPQLDENDPETLENMVSYLDREQYGDWSYVDRRAPLWEYQIKKMYIRYFGWQFIGRGETLGEDGRVVENLSLNGLAMLPFILGIIGMFHHFRKNWHHGSFVMTLFFMTGLAIVLYLNQEDPQPRERDYVYVGSFMAFAIWIGIGASALLDYVKQQMQKFGQKQRLIAVIAGVLILLLLSPYNLLSFNYESHDRTGNFVAYDYSYNILQSCEPNAILFTNGDNDTFPLWFLQFVYGIREDVRVVNLSLLNTHWYIRQLRDEHPRVPISLNDNQIDALQPQLWEEAKTVSIPVPKDAYLRDLSDVFDKKQLIEEVETPPAIKFKLKPTLYGRGIRVQDIMIINIINTNRFRRPIYFALTVSKENQINLDNYLRMDGLAYKLVTYPDQDISPPFIKNNLINKFQYRNLNNEEVYYNENIKGLLRNYHGAYFSLARFYFKEKMYDDMTEVLDHLFEVMPDTVIPMRPELQIQYASMYLEGGQKEKADELMNRVLKNSDVNVDNKLQFVSYVYRDDSKTAIEKIQQLRQQHPSSSNVIYYLASYYIRDKEYEKGIGVLDEWLATHPNDKTALSQKEQLERYIEQTKPKQDTTAPAKPNLPTDSLMN